MEKRSNLLVVLSKEQKELLKQLAKKSNLSMSSYVKLKSLCND